MEIPADIAMQQAAIKTETTLSMIKKSAQADQALANMVKKASDEIVQSGISASRGNNLNIFV